MSKRLKGHLHVLWDWVIRKTTIAEEKNDDGYLRRKRRIRILYVSYGFFMALFLSWVAWGAVNDYVKPQTPDERTKLLQTAAQIAAGIVLLIGLYFTWRSFQLNREGQITERFTRAIDQLGSEQVSVRIGGIYALERIARDSIKDAATIKEVYLSFLQDAVRLAPDPNVDEVDQNTDIGIPTPLDIQSVINALGRRIYRDNEYDGGSLRLDRLNLDNADFDFLDFRYSTITGSNLRQASFHRAFLNKSFFAHDRLQQANFSSSSISGCFFWRGRMSHASFSHAEGRGTSFDGCDLKSSDFSSAILVNSVFGICKLDGANFSSSDLSNVDFRFSTIDNTIFHEANLTGANFCSVDMSAAQGLTQEQIEVVIVDEKTILPIHTNP